MTIYKLNWNLTTWSSYSESQWKIGFTRKSETDWFSFYISLATQGGWQAARVNHCTKQSRYGWRSKHKFPEVSPNTIQMPQGLPKFPGFSQLNQTHLISRILIDSAQPLHRISINCTNEVIRCTLHLQQPKCMPTSSWKKYHRWHCS
jgi:hypothetical protein